MRVDRGRYVECPEQRYAHDEERRLGKMPAGAYPDHSPHSSRVSHVFESRNYALLPPPESKHEASWIFTLDVEVAILIDETLWEEVLRIWVGFRVARNRPEHGRT